MTRGTHIFIENFSLFAHANHWTIIANYVVVLLLIDGVGKSSGMMMSKHITHEIWSKISSSTRGRWKNLSC
jgi:hypothetical protein